MFLNLYSNGKSAVRVDAPGVHQAGPHRFTGPPDARCARARAHASPPEAGAPQASRSAAPQQQPPPRAWPHPPSPRPHVPRPRWATPDNPEGQWLAAVSRTTQLLNYAYASPADVAAQLGESGCPPAAAAAARAGDFSQARARVRMLPVLPSSRHPLYLAHPHVTLTDTLPTPQPLTHPPPLRPRPALFWTST